MEPDKEERFAERRDAPDQQALLSSSPQNGGGKGSFARGAALRSSLASLSSPELPHDDASSSAPSVLLPSRVSVSSDSSSLSPSSARSPNPQQPALCLSHSGRGAGSCSLPGTSDVSEPAAGVLGGSSMQLPTPLSAGSPRGSSEPAPPRSSAESGSACTVRLVAEDGPTARLSPVSPDNVARESSSPVSNTQADASLPFALESVNSPICLSGSMCSREVPSFSPPLPPPSTRHLEADTQMATGRTDDKPNESRFAGAVDAVSRSLPSSVATSGLLSSPAPLRFPAAAVADGSAALPTSSLSSPDHQEEHEDDKVDGASMLHAARSSRLPSSHVSRPSSSSEFSGSAQERSDRPTETQMGSVACRSAGAVFSADASSIAGSACVSPSRAAEDFGGSMSSSGTSPTPSAPSRGTASRDAPSSEGVSPAASSSSCMAQLSGATSRAAMGSSLLLSVLRPVLMRLLPSSLQDVVAENMLLQLWQKQLSLQDVTLHPRLFDSLHLPFSLLYGYIGLVRVYVPSKQGTPQGRNVSVVGGGCHTAPQAPASQVESSYAASPCVEGSGKTELVERAVERVPEGDVSTDQAGKKEMPAGEPASTLPVSEEANREQSPERASTVAPSNSPSDVSSANERSSRISSSSSPGADAAAASSSSPRVDSKVASASLVVEISNLVLVFAPKPVHECSESDFLDRLQHQRQRLLDMADVQLMSAAGHDSAEQIQAGESTVSRKANRVASAAGPGRAGGLSRPFAAAAAMLSRWVNRLLQDLLIDIKNVHIRLEALAEIHDGTGRRTGGMPVADPLRRVCASSPVYSAECHSASRLRDKNLEESTARTGRSRRVTKAGGCRVPSEERCLVTSARPCDECTGRGCSKERKNPTGEDQSTCQRSAHPVASSSVQMQPFAVGLTLRRLQIRQVEKSVFAAAEAADAPDAARFWGEETESVKDKPWRRDGAEPVVGGGEPAEGKTTCTAVRGSGNEGETEAVANKEASSETGETGEATGRSSLACGAPISTEGGTQPGLGQGVENTSPSGREEAESMPKARTEDAGLNSDPSPFRFRVFDVKELAAYVHSETLFLAPTTARETDLQRKLLSHLERGAGRPREGDGESRSSQRGVAFSRGPRGESATPSGPRKDGVTGDELRTGADRISDQISSDRAASCEEITCQETHSRMNPCSDAQSDSFLRSPPNHIVEPTSARVGDLGETTDLGKTGDSERPENAGDRRDEYHTRCAANLLGPLLCHLLEPVSARLLLRQFSGDGGAAGAGSAERNRAGPGDGRPSESGPDGASQKPEAATTQQQETGASRRDGRAEAKGLEKKEDGRTGEEEAAYAALLQMDAVQLAVPVGYVGHALWLSRVLSSHQEMLLLLQQRTELFYPYRPHCGGTETLYWQLACILSVQQACVFRIQVDPQSRVVAYAITMTGGRRLPAAQVY